MDTEPLLSAEPRGEGTDDPELVGAVIDPVRIHGPTVAARYSDFAHNSRFITRRLESVSCGLESFFRQVELLANGLKVVGVFLERIGVPLASRLGDEVAPVDVVRAGVRAAGFWTEWITSSPSSCTSPSNSSLPPEQTIDSPCRR